MSEKKNKREWIKTAAIVFLSIMLVLTFFSNTILNYSLPEVATEYVQSGSITAKIRGTGVIEGTDPYVVKLDEGEMAKVISSIEFRKGEHVDEGDTLMKFSTKKVVGLEEAKQSLKLANEAYDAVVKELESAVLKGILTNDKKNQLLNGKTGSYNDYLTAITTIEQQITETENNLAQYKQALAQCELYLSLNTADALIDKDAALAEMNVAKEFYEAAQNVLNGKQQRVIDLENAMAATENEEEKAAYQAELEEIRAQWQTLEADVAAKKAAYDEKAAYYNKPINYEYQSSLKLQYEYLIRTCQENLTVLNENRNAVSTDSDNEYMYYTKVKQAKDAVNEAKKQVETLESNGEVSEITAPISGTVEEIYFKSGEEVSAGQVVMSLQPDGKGYTMSVSVTNEQAKNVSVGDRAEIVNGWYFYDVDVTVASIKPDRTDPAKKKMLTFDVTGTISAGQSLTVSVGQRSAQYDLIVPNSAIKEDNNGKFVLIVDSKSSPLGNRYIASRVDVQVIASDDTRSAISGALNGWEYVITTASKPVEAGKQIRLSEN